MSMGDKSMIEGLSSSEARIPLAAADVLQPRELVR
jgi:hypothetical protein